MPFEYLWRIYIYSDSISSDYNSNSYFHNNLHHIHNLVNCASCPGRRRRAISKSSGFLHNENEENR